MRQFVLSLLLLSATSAAHAQVLRVQSGDHEGFTRLVIPIGVDRDWEIVETETRTWTVVIDPEIDGFDTSASFDLIQRSRLADLTDDDQTLTLALACDCDVNGSRYQDRYLVIDIADPSPEAEADDVDLPENDDSGQEDRLRAAAALPDLADVLNAPNQLPRLEPSIRDIEPEPATEEPAPDARGPNPDLAEAAEIMAEQLARAAASGLLDASLGQPHSFADPVERSETRPPDPVEDGAPEHSALEDQDDRGLQVHAETDLLPLDELPIRTHTSLDPAAQIDHRLSVSAPENSCRGEPFDPRAWAEARSFQQGLGELRAELYDARDILSEDAAHSMALYYLFHGFGAEARHWLTQLSDPAEDYFHVADIVDGAEATGFEPVADLTNCSQGELLWRYLGGSVAVDLNSDDLSAIQRAYSELPIHLRDLLGPRLARMLSDDDHSAAARNVRDILQRGGRLSEAELHLLDLDLDLPLAGPDSETRRVLSNILSNSGSTAVAAMAQALAFDRSVGIRPTPERLVAAEALIRETGTGPDTDLLWQEVLLGHAALGSVDTALEMLGDPARDGGPRETALTALIADRVSVNDTAALLVLAHTFGADWRPQGSEAGRAQISAIAMLREAGLYEAAQILRDVRQPLILPSRDNEETAGPDPLEAAWDLADWEQISELATGPHADLAARLVARVDDPVAENAAAQDLDALSSIVSDSRTLRSTIGAILDDPNPE